MVTDEGIDVLDVLRQALDLIPRVSADDPVVPALADWCSLARNTIRDAARTALTVKEGL